MKPLVPIIALILAATTMAQDEYSKPVDERSYHLGVMGGFSEVVKYGVKELALSEVMSPEEMDDILHDALVVARRNGVEMWREPDLLVSDLFPADVAKGKHVLLIYKGDTLDKYLAIKDDKAKLVAAGKYEGAAREQIARQFGRLLSYSEPAIDDLIRRNAAK